MMQPRQRIEGIQRSLGLTDFLNDRQATTMDRRKLSEGATPTGFVDLLSSRATYIIRILFI